MVVKTCGRWWPQNFWCKWLVAYVLAAAFVLYALHSWAWLVHWGYVWKLNSPPKAKNVSPDLNHLFLSWSFPFLIIWCGSWTATIINLDVSCYVLQDITFLLYTLYVFVSVARFYNFFRLLLASSAIWLWPIKLSFGSCTLDFYDLGFLFYWVLFYHEGLWSHVNVYLSYSQSMK